MSWPTMADVSRVMQPMVRCARPADAVDAALATRRVVLAPPRHRRNQALIAETGLERDLTLLAGVEGVDSGGAPLREAEAAAARCWGADLARFSVAGSTFANPATREREIPLLVDQARGAHFGLHPAAGLREWIGAGLRVTGATDPTLDAVRVVEAR